MAEPVRLQTPHVNALMASGEVLTVQVLNPDYLAWDRTAAKHGWAGMSKIPFTWLTFVTWAALRRTGQVSLTWEDFSERECVQVSNVTETTNGATPPQVPGLEGLAGLEVLVGGLEGSDPEAEAETVGPTPPGLAPG